MSTSTNNNNTEPESSKRTKKFNPSPYTAVARYNHSVHLDYDPEITNRVKLGRNLFSDAINRMSSLSQELGVPDSEEMDQAVRLMNQAKDKFVQHLIHAIGTVDGVPFEKAVRSSVDSCRDEIARSLLVGVSHSSPLLATDSLIDMGGSAVTTSVLEASKS